MLEIPLNNEIRQPNQSVPKLVHITGCILSTVTVASQRTSARVPCILQSSSLVHMPFQSHGFAFRFIHPADRRATAALAEFSSPPLSTLPRLNLSSWYKPSTARNSVIVS